MNIFKTLFSKKEVKTSKPVVTDEMDKNYVCLTIDPIHTVNDIRKGDWNTNKLQDSLRSGMMRYARQSEIQKAKELGIIKE